MSRAEYMREYRARKAGKVVVEEDLSGDPIPKVVEMKNDQAELIIRLENKIGVQGQLIQEQEEEIRRLKRLLAERDRPRTEVKSDTVNPFFRPYSKADQAGKKK